MQQPVPSVPREHFAGDAHRVDFPLLPLNLRFFAMLRNLPAGQRGREFRHPLIVEVIETP
jgi:hypothetical protein